MRRPTIRSQWKTRSGTTRKESMDSKPSNLHQLLPWFVNGTLEVEEARAFERHLEGCGACREEITLWSSMRQEIERHGEAFFASHPEPAAIVAAARAGLTETGAPELRQHLAFCSTCATEARLARDDAGPSTGTPLRARAVDRLRSLGRHDALRWLLPSLVAVAALVIAVIGRRPSTAPRPGTRLVPAYYVEAQERAAEIPVVALSRQSDLFQVVLPVDLAPGSYPLAIEIRDSRGRIAFRQDGVTSAYRDRFLFIVCDGRDFPDGGYVARVAASGPAAEGRPATVVEFRFRVRRD